MNLYRWSAYLIHCANQCRSYTNELNGLNGLKFVRFTFIVPEPSRKQLFANQILGQFCNRFDLAISGQFPCYFWTILRLFLVAIYKIFPVKLPGANEFSMIGLAGSF